MTRRRGAAALLCVLLFAGCDRGSAEEPVKSRTPNHEERKAVVRAMPAFVRCMPVECVRLDIRLSQDGRHALVGFEFLNVTRPGSRCITFNGSVILRREDKWRIVYTGSDPPSCALGVPEELIGGCLER